MKTKHLLLWSSLGTLVLLMYAAISENLLRDWRTIQKQMHTPAGPVEEQLRQVVAPRLKALDRCVSCHVGMAPGESEVSGHTLAAVHKPVVHDPHQYGCTVCHAGQGRATEQADAHGQVPFWPSPMIPAKSMFTLVAVAVIPTPTFLVWKELSRSCQTVERLDCLGCHRRWPWRDSQARGKGGMEGPDLSRVGITGYDAEWYQRHLAHSSSVSEPLWQDLFKQVVAQDLEAVKVCLESRVGAPSLVEAKALFNSLGCRGCHKVNGVGGDDGPDLTLEGERDPGQLNFSGVRGPHTLDNWLREHFQAPSTVVPGSAMPALGLSEEEIDKLTLYMLSLRSAAPEALWPKIEWLNVSAVVSLKPMERRSMEFLRFVSRTNGEGRRFPGQVPFPAVMAPTF
jgi:cytochrome c2